MSALSLARAMEEQGLVDGKRRHGLPPRLPGESFDAWCERLGLIEVDWALIESAKDLPKAMKGNGRA